MDIKLITAIVRASRLEAVEERLKAIHVSGITVSRAKGYGEYADFLAHDWMVGCVRIDIFAELSRAQAVAESIADAAHTGAQGDGLVAILPVDRVIRVRTGRDAHLDGGLP